MKIQYLFSSHNTSLNSTELYSGGEIKKNKKPDLKDDQNFSIVLLQGYVKGRFIKLAKRMDISSIFDK